MSVTIASFVAFASQAADVAALKSFAAGRGLDENHIHQGNIVQATEYLKSNPSPEVLLVELPSRTEAPDLLNALAEVCDPNTKVITTGTINEYSFYCWLTDIGITQYLLSPLTEQALEGAFEKLQTAMAGEQKDKPPCKVIAVMGARGGVGATTIAINLAAILGDQTHHKVALVDLDPQEGSVALALDIQPSMGVRDVLEKPDRIDSLFLERVMSKVGKYLSVLSAEESLSEALAVNEHAARPLLEELKSKYDYIVLDVPRHMSRFAVECLKNADHTVLVTELSLLCLRDTLRMQDAMRDGWKTKPPIVVANRVGLASRQEVPVADFEKGTGAKVADRVPFAPDIFMPMSQEIAALQQKTHPAVKPLYHLAALIAPAVKVAQPTRKKSAFGFSFFKKKQG